MSIEIFPDFGQDPDRDAMSMETKSVLKQILNHISQSIKEKRGWKESSMKRKLISEKPDNNQELL